MGSDYYGFDGAVTPDLDIDRVREDFQMIFERNAVEVEVIRHMPPANNYPSGQTPNGEIVDENSDFFGTRTPSKVFRKRIKIVVYAKNTDDYSREQYGLNTANRSFGAYALFDTDIINNDLIKFVKTTNVVGFKINRNTMFRVASHNRPFYKGQYCYQEFDLSSTGDTEQAPTKSYPEVWGD